MRMRTCVADWLLAVLMLVLATDGLADEGAAEDGRTGDAPAAEAAAEEGTTVAGVVVDPEGTPVAGEAVTLHVGWARYKLTPAFDRWLAVETKTATTGGDGRFQVAGVPEGAVVTAYVNTGIIGVAQGTGELEVTLRPTGGVLGKVTGKRKDLKAMRVFVQGGMGLGSGEIDVDKKNGKFEVRGLAPGPGRVHVMMGRSTVACFDVEIAAGESTKTRTTKYRGKLLPTSDPLVEVTKARLVDPEGDPVPKVQLSWSSQWMDGGMGSDEDGVVKLAGGGVAIGGPPYFLRLSSLQGEHGRFRGELKKVKRGVAIVELRPLREVKGTVKRADVAIETYRLLVVGPGEPGQVYYGGVGEDGTFTVWVPDGDCRFVVGTVDGKVQEHAVAVAPDTRAVEIPLK